MTGAERIKIKSDEARAAGLCPSCRWRIPKPGRVTCQHCIDQAQDRRRAWRDAGLCVDCVRPHPDGTRRCVACQKAHGKRNNESKKATRAPCLPTATSALRTDSPGASVRCLCCDSPWAIPDLRRNDRRAA